MIVKWDLYVRRKKIDVAKWIKRHNIGNYKELVETSIKLDVSPPEEKLVSKYFNAHKEKKNDKSNKKPSQASGKPNKRIYKKSVGTSTSVVKPKISDKPEIETEKKKQTKRTRKKRVSKQ
jgi:hypothetical protein